MVIQEEKEPQAEEPKGGNGQGGPDGETGNEVKLTKGVKSWLPYCGRPVSVHLKFAILMMDWAGDVIELPMERDGKVHMVPVGIAAPATFRDVEASKGSAEPMVTDTLERVLMQPSPCGRKLVLLHRTEQKLGQSGAGVGHVVRPRDINSVSFVDRIPEMIARPKHSGLIVPGQQ